MTATARSRRVNASRQFGARLLAACSLALLPSLAVAKKSDRDQPMNVASKQSDAYNAPNTVTTLTGSVKITQGTLLLTGDLAKIYLDANSQISHIVVTGKLAHIQQLDESNNLMTGDADQLDYDNIHGIAVLTGHAVVNQKTRGTFRGDKLTYNTDTSQITGESSGDGLVHGVIMPKSRPPAAAAGAPAPQKKHHQHDTPPPAAAASQGASNSNQGQP